MPSKTVTVGSAIGLHARPAAIIAEAVVNAGVPVTLSMDGGEPVDAGSAPATAPAGSEGDGESKPAGSRNRRRRRSSGSGSKAASTSGD